MSSRDHVFSIVATLQPVVQGVSTQDADRPTPCPDWTVRDAANHLLGTAEAMRRIGAGEPLDPQDPWGTGGDHLHEDWRDDLSDLLTRWAKSWSQPEAWEGEAMDGAMPKQVIGDMGFVEVMLHGWDLARGTGQDLAYDDAAVEQALAVMDEIGEQGRSQGAFGPEKDVPDDASTFARVLAKAGRDSEWTAG